MNKKWIALALTAALTLNLSACGSKANGGVSSGLSPDGSAISSQEGSVSSEPDGSVSVPEEGEEELPPTEDPAAESEQKPVQKPETPEQKPAQKPEQQPAAPKPAEQKPAAGSQSGAESNSSSSAGADAAQSVDLSAFYDQMVAKDSFPPSMQKLTGEEAGVLYEGLGDVSLKQCTAGMAAVSAVVGELILAEVSDSKDVQTVKDIFQARIDSQVNGGAFYPDTIDGWKVGGRVASHGNYVMMVALGDPDEADAAVAAFQALFA